MRLPVSTPGGVSRQEGPGAVVPSGLIEGFVAPDAPQHARPTARAPAPKPAAAPGRSARWLGARALLVGCALLGGCGLLAACGFRLEGRTPLPKALHVTYVEAKDRQTDFVQGLRRALIIAGAQVTDRSENATAVVHVMEDTVTPRVVAVSSTNLPREYEITYTVRFSVTADGKDLLAPQDVSATRDYAFDEYVVLAKDNEDAILRAALARNLVEIVMRRLSSL